MLEGLQKILVISYAFSSLPLCHGVRLDGLMIVSLCVVCDDICGDCEAQSPLYQFNVM